jgi:Mg2+ and Co2+ transporter CorA
MKQAPKNRKREIKQLWFMAKHYFSLSTRIKNKLNTAQLKLTPKDTAQTWNNQPKPSSNLKRFTLMLAHLSSCAIRLNTIDEILNSTRWQIYQQIKRNKQLSIRILRKKSKNIIHCLLRHIVAHSEPSSKSKSQYIEMENYLQSLSLQQIYTKMNSVINSIRKELLDNGTI